MLVLGFTVHNIVKYVVMQKRYKSWLVVIFYVLSVIVLISRILQFMITTYFYSYLDKIFNQFTTRELITTDYNDMVDIFRKIGYFYITADYSKFALGWFQLASMSELAIAIQFEVTHFMS